MHVATLQFEYLALKIKYRITIYVHSYYITLAIFVQADKDKESATLPDQHDDTNSDVTERPPAFINRMHNFKAELEEIKVILEYTCTCIHI